MSQKTRPGSWNTVVIIMIFAYTTGKYIVSRCGACAAPAMILANFLAKKYEEDIDQWARKIKENLKGFWSKLGYANQT